MTLHLPDILGGAPVRWISTYGTKSAVEVLGHDLVVVLPTSALVEVEPATVPAGVSGYQIGTRGGAS